MTIRLLTDIRNVGSSGQTVTVDAALEADLVSRRAATYVSQAGTNIDPVVRAVTNPVTGGIELSAGGSPVEIGAGETVADRALKLRHFYKALYEGSTVSGGNFTRPKTVVRIGVFGDSVGNSKPLLINNRLRQAIGEAGGFFSTMTLSGGATSESNTNVGTYWINGGWYTVPAGGEVLYQVGGGRPTLTQIKIFYIKEPGAGTFKVQTRNSGGAHTDEAGYESVSADDSSVGLGVITLTKALGQWDLKVVGLTGTVRFIRAAYEDATNGGAAVYQFDVGGLPLATAAQTPVSIKAAVMNAIGLDMAFMEFKDGGDFPAAFSNWTEFWSGNVTKPCSWVFIGTTPEQVEVTAGSTSAVTNNAIQKAFADANGYLYFDGYNPLVNWGMIVAMGWGGDGTHLPAAAHAYLGSQLWQYLGFDTLVEVPVGQSVRSKSIDVYDGKLSFSTGRTEVGSLKATSDIEVSSSRGYLFRDLSGNNSAFIRCAGGSQNTFGALAFGAPFGSNLPHIWPSSTNGLYFTNGAANSQPTIWLGALSYKVGSSLGGPEIFAGAASPEGVKTAPVGSIYLRSDGGAGTTLYVKESGTGNTGWIAK